jgi:hypothetical protein
MKFGLFLLAVFLVVWPCFAQQAAAPASSAAQDYSGMYSFLKDGEFIQINLEDGGSVTGFISRYGDADSDRGAFLDQFFKTAKLEGANLDFATKTVHGVWYQFKGQFIRGDGKNPGDEAFYVLKGTLTENTTGADQKANSTSRNVSFKSFPRNLDSAH